MVAVVLILSFAVLFAAYFLGRFGVARACGVRGARAALGLRDDAWEGASLVARFGTAAGGFLGYYLGVALLGALGVLLSGETRIDEASMRVTVAPDGPAARAGIVSGDRIISVGGTPTPDWTLLKSEVAKHPGEPVDVVVERDGAPRTITVTPGSGGVQTGKIMVGPHQAHVDASFGAAVARGFAQPFVVVAATARAFVRLFSGSEHPELSGPVGLVRETKSASDSSFGAGLRLVSALASYFFYVALIVSALTVPRPRKKA